MSAITIAAAVLSATTTVIVPVTAGTVATTSEVSAARTAAASAEPRRTWQEPVVVQWADAATAPDRSPIVGVPGSAGYSFLLGGRRPRLAWDPCRTIRWGIDTTYAVKVGARPAWEIQRWKSVVADVAAASGYRFSFAGTFRSSSETGFQSGAPEGIDLGIVYQSSKAGQRQYRNPSFAGAYGIIGFGGMNGWSGAGESQTSGFVQISAPWLADRPEIMRSPSLAGVDLVRSLYLHEFGHAMGLGHVRDKQQMMFPMVQNGLDDRYGHGDRTGLRILGSTACQPTAPQRPNDPTSVPPQDVPIDDVVPVPVPDAPIEPDAPEDDPSWDDPSWEDQGDDEQDGLDDPDQDVVEIERCIDGEPDC